MKFTPIMPLPGIPPVKKITPRLTFRDTLGGVLVRFDIGRNNYRVQSGLYACGSPDHTASVLVTSNYKLTFDSVRKELHGQNLWILVLDTHGVNVWCAAGKGTFGTEELLHRIKATKLSSVVSHRQLILPQLGASGIAAHKVRAASGFNVTYGPVYARDIPAYLANGKMKTDKMKRVEFRLLDRLSVSPVEIAHAWPLVLITSAVAMLLSLPLDSQSLHRFYFSGLSLTGGVLAGTILFPALLPFLPFRSFSAKGAILGALWALACAYITGFLTLKGLPTMLMTIPLVSFLSMNFTGASTFTCQKGAELEVKKGIPLMLLFALAGILLAVIL